MTSLEASRFRAATASPIGSRISLSDEPVAAACPEQGPGQLLGRGLVGVRSHAQKCNSELHSAPHPVRVSQVTRPRRLGFCPCPRATRPPSPPRRSTSPPAARSARSPAGATEVMHRPARPVTAYDEELRALVADMVATMYAADGVGLAACQIGVDLAVFVFDCPDESVTIHRGVVCNPVARAARGQRAPARRRRRGLPVLPGRVRRLRPARPGPGDRPGPRRRGRRLRGRRPAGAVPAARDRPHPRHGLRRPAQRPLAQEAAQADGGRRRGLPGWAGRSADHWARPTATRPSAD